VTKTYDPATDPYNDGWDNGGFDTVGHIGNAKNIMTVGAVNDAVSGGVRSPAAATMSTFSCWGPTDDGRVKPDIVANGVGLYSSLSAGDSSMAPTQDKHVVAQRQRIRHAAGRLLGRRLQASICGPACSRG
jgi:hypothetical protein